MKIWELLFMSALANSFFHGFSLHLQRIFISRIPQFIWKMSGI